MAKKLNNTLAKLKEDVLDAILNNKLFQEKNIQLSFADLPFVLSQADVYLVDNDVKHNINIEKLNKPIKIVTEDFVKQHAEQNGKTIYFQFESIKQETNTILLNLIAKIYSSADNRISNLSSMQMTFKNVGGEWEIMDAPTSLSA